MSGFARRMAVIGGVAAIALVATGCLSVQLSKKVVGGTWAPTYSVKVDCPSGNLTVDGPTHGPDQTTLTFGNGIPGGVASFSFFKAGTCTLTEPQNGGASTVSIACVDPPPHVTCTSAPGSLVIQVPDLGFQQLEMGIEVTNTFVPPSSPPTTGS